MTAFRPPDDLLGCRRDHTEDEPVTLPLLHRQAATLPALEAFAFVQILTNGGHHPLLFQMKHQGAPAGLWVLKPVFSMSASNRRAGLGVIAEIVGLAVCGWLGVATPAGALFRMPHDASDLMKTVPASDRDEVAGVFSLNRDLLAYCSRYVDGSTLAEPALLPQRASRAFVDQAARLLLADVFLCHHDRQIDNANTLLLGNKLVAIDHGDALAGLDKPGETGDGLASRTVLSSAMKSHFLLAWLRRRASDVD